MSTQATHPTLLNLLRRGAPLLAAAVLAGCASSGPVFDTPDTDFEGLVYLTDAAYPGGEARVQGYKFKPGQTINLLRGDQQLLDGPVTADDKGGFKASFPVPADAATGLQPVLVQVSGPDAAQVLDLKISEPVQLAGAEAFDVAARHLRPGLYQGAWSARAAALFVTATTFSPSGDGMQSTLMKVDPQTLEVMQAVSPTAGDGAAAAKPIFGVAVDDATGTVWVSNTVANTVAVYTQDELALIEQLDDDLVTYARELVVDDAHGRVYVSSSMAPYIGVFDARTRQPVGRIDLPSQADNGKRATPMALALDAAGGKLYTASRSTNEAFVIDLATQAVQQVIALPGARGASGVAVAPEQGLLFVASQDSDSLHIVDLRDGSVRRQLTVGAGPLSVAWEPQQALAYVASRGSDSIAVVDAAGDIVAQLDGGSFSNQVFTDGNGHVFALNKARGEDDESGDFIRRIRKR